MACQRYPSRIEVQNQLALAQHQHSLLPGCHISGLWNICDVQGLVIYFTHTVPLVQAHYVNKFDWITVRKLLDHTKETELPWILATL